MANSPSQFPQIDLPGAEYTALAPNGTIAISSQRAINAAAGTPPGTPISIPASTTASITFSALAEQNWTRGAGMWIRLMNGIVGPSDNSGQIQITGLRLAVAGTNTFADLDIGTPLATLQSPTQVITAISVSNLLISQNDMTSMGPFTGQFFFTFSATFHNNDATNPHSINIFLKGLYVRLDGFTQ